MKFFTTKLILLFQLGFLGHLFAQEPFFFNPSIQKTFESESKWVNKLRADAKTNVDQDYFRFGFDIKKTCETKFWAPFVGLRTAYMIDKKAVDNLEIRPFIGTILNVPIVGGLALEQELTYEQRFFISGESGEKIAKPSSYRFVFTPTLIYSFINSTGALKGLSIFGGYTWNFVEFNDTNERYAAERNFEGGFKKKLSGKKLISLSFTRENYFSFLRSNTGYAKGLSIKYGF